MVLTMSARKERERKLAVGSMQLIWRLQADLLGALWYAYHSVYPRKSFMVSTALVCVNIFFDGRRC